MIAEPAVKLPASPWHVRVLTILWLIGAVYIAIHQRPYPRAAGPDAPIEKFSSARAMLHLRHLSKTPHPAGTRENEAVGSYILERVTALGLKPELQETTIVYRPDTDYLAAAHVRNILVRKNGHSNTKAVLLVAHYDSAVASPGAGDDGVAVACLLETLRALQMSSVARNDVILLFTDGEEIGLAGARAFVARHPWAKDVGVVLNFEARGTSGPSILFETINGDNGLVREFARAAPSVYGNSILPTIYKVMPHDTDLSVFKSLGVPGMNFAFAEGWSNYHSPLDSLEAIDERSVQHHGGYALELTRHLADLDLMNLPKDDAVYFNLIGSTFIQYPSSRVWIQVVLITLGLMTAIILGFCKGRVTISGLFSGFVAQLVIVIASSAATLVCVKVAFRLSNNWKAFFESGYYYLGTVCLALAVVALLCLVFLRKTSMENLHFGSLLWWCGLSVAGAILVPQVTYIFVWPLMIGIGLRLYPLFTPGKSRHRAARVAALWLACLPVLFLLAPMVHLLFIGLTDETVVVASILVVLCSGLLLPVFELVFIPRAHWLSIGLLVASAALLLIAILNAKSGPTHPQENQVLYLANLDQGTAVWATLLADKEDSWTAQFFAGQGNVTELSKFVPDLLYPTARILQRTAPKIDLAPATVKVVEDDANGDLHRLKLLIRSPGRSPETSIYVESPTGIVSLELDHDSPRDDEVQRPSLASASEASASPPKLSLKVCLRYYGISEDGATLLLETRRGGPIRMKIFERSYNLPAIPGLRIRPRTAEFQEAGELGDGIITYRSFTFN